MATRPAIPQPEAYNVDGTASPHRIRLFGISYDHSGFLDGDIDKRLWGDQRFPMQKAWFFEMLLCHER